MPTPLDGPLPSDEAALVLRGMPYTSVANRRLGSFKRPQVGRDELLSDNICQENRNGKYQFGLNIGFWNINNRGKTAERFARTVSECMIRELDIVGVAETYLIEDEGVPSFDGYSAVTSNRESDDIKGGGTAILVKSSINYEEIQINHPDIVGIKVECKMGEILVLTVYVAPGRSPEQRDCQYNTIRSFLESNSKPVILLGDFNAKMSNIDGINNQSGQLLSDLARQFNLSILNLSNFCEGRYTFQRGSQRTTTDYILCSTILEKYFRKIVIDEGSCEDIGTDHNIVYALTRVSKQKKRRDFIEIEVLDNEIFSAEFEKRLEDMQMPNYQELKNIYKICKEISTKKKKV